MRRVTTAWRVALCSLLAAPAVSAQEAYTNGRWFDGQTFRPGTRYVVNGRFVAARPARIVRTVDLGGAYVVPPFAEAHTHNVESSRFDAVNRLHIGAGVFYVKNPNGLPRFTIPLTGRINVPGALDVSFAHGGLTGSGGHPVAIAARQIARGTWTDADGDGGFYWIVDDSAMLAEKWPRILAGKPDFIKTYLLYSEQYAARRTDTTFRDWRGLDPALLPAIVRRAHAAGKRVSTHVETAADFRAAVRAGVDEINHLPGFRPERNDPAYYEPVERFALSDEDARRAAQARITVVTTAGEVIEILRAIPDTSAQAPMAKRALTMLRSNLQRLQRHGVRIAVGSDQYGRSADYEAQQLALLGAVDNRTVLKWWVENAPATIFPGRRIGHLLPGYEASFLVLDGNPLDDFMATSRITRRVKQGIHLNADGSR
jgi:imidazolonepropionase-like amidohydrolase